MINIRKTSVYKKWFKALRDSRARYQILARIERLSEGNAGDSSPIGEGLSEMRIHCGPGYRVYYKDTGKEIVILLCGGDKSTQQADIARAKQIAALPLEEEDIDGTDNGQ
jgi:putative addiction module killer protein